MSSAAQSVLELTLLHRPLRYHVRTATAVRVGSMQLENELLYVAEQTLLDRTPVGYLLQVEVLHAMQKAEDLFSRVTADVNQASRRLLLRTNAHGQLLRVENQPELVQQWQQLYPSLRTKYAQEEAVGPFLRAFDQQIQQPGSLEANLRYKGLYGALLPGFYGHTYGRAAPIEEIRCIPAFFNTLDLPLRLRTTEQPLSADQASTFPQALRLITTGKLDADAFATADFRRLLRTVADDPTYPVDLTVDYEQEHLVDKLTGLLLASEQILKAEVSGLYHNAITHHVQYKRADT